MDDIDHLGNRRVRSVGELVENAFRIGLTRMERTIKEKMTITADLASAMPQDLINSKPVIAALKEFFGSSQLSQFMDQINSLAEVTHKRRLSALGPGGLSRERAGFEVRDIQASHYGRICPVETPEGPNIGLISSLSCYARVNDYGFIETPYRKVKDGRIIDYVKILHPGDSRLQGRRHRREGRLHQGDRPPSSARRPATMPAGRAVLLLPDRLGGGEVHHRPGQRPGRREGLFPRRPHQRPAGRQLQAPAQGPDRLHRRLAQAARLPVRGPGAVPRARRRQPGPDGLEHAAPGRAAPPARGPADRDGHRAPRGQGLGRRHRLPSAPGTVEFVDAERILIRVDETGQRQGLRGRDRPLPPDQVPPDQPEHLPHPAAHRPPGRPRQGRPGPGRQLLLRPRASCPWAGTCCAPSCPGAATTSRTPSSSARRLIKKDIFTSLHIVEETIEARDTKLGPEEITRDIPNVPEDVLRNLDENGIVRIGAHVKSGDVLVGKVAPKGETQLSPEEKLLKAIFGEKALDVKDASLYCSPGVEGTIIDVRIFSRRGTEKGNRAKLIEKDEIGRMKRNLDDEITILETERWRKIKALLKGAVLEKDQKVAGADALTKGQKLTEKVLDEIDRDDVGKLKVEAERERDERIKDIEKKAKRQIEALRAIFKDKVEGLKKGDELAPGVIQAIKVFIAMKRKLSVGDKVSGRHGNKGIIARIVPEEDMPRLPDGTPVEIVLNPLGVPSRMNVGQILETHAGWAADKLGLWISTPVFDGCTEREVKDLLGGPACPRPARRPSSTASPASSSTRRSRSATST